MTANRLQWVWAGCLISLAYPASSAEEVLKLKARELLRAHREAVVSVKLAIATQLIVEGQQQDKHEETMEAAGTVIDPSGLTVLSLSDTDQDLDGAQESERDGDGERLDFKVEGHVSEVKIVLADGTEVPGRQVLLDQDLDLVFVKPRAKPEHPWPCVKFARAEPSEVLDDIILIEKLGRAVNRECGLSLGTIQAVLRKPRLSYVCQISCLGCPVFNAKGEALGLTVLRRAPLNAGYDRFSDDQPVILPAADVLEAAQQALAAPTREATPAPEAEGKKAQAPSKE